MPACRARAAAVARGGIVVPANRLPCGRRMGNVLETCCADSAATVRHRPAIRCSCYTWPPGGACWMRCAYQHQRIELLLNHIAAAAAAAGLFLNLCLHHCGVRCCCRHRCSYSFLHVQPSCNRHCLAAALWRLWLRCEARDTGTPCPELDEHLVSPARSPDRRCRGAPAGRDRLATPPRATAPQPARPRCCSTASLRYARSTTGCASSLQPSRIRSAPGVTIRASFLK